MMQWYSDKQMLVLACTFAFSPALPLTDINVLELLQLLHLAVLHCCVLALLL